ncbi:MAG: FAD-binding oxidoreductase, partial [Chitinophagaceae bacterium]
MQLHSPLTYSLASSGPVPEYSPLREDIDAEVLVMGTGISGALTAWHLQRAGFTCTLIDRRAAATGSTAASTSLLQYELDTSLCTLSDRIGRKAAEASYLLCYEAIDQLQQVCVDCGVPALFEPRSSLQWASKPRHLKALREEVARRKAIGLDVELLGAAELSSDYFLEKAGGLYSRKAAQIDAYSLTQTLLRNLVYNGATVYAHTEATHIDWKPKEVVVQTGNGNRIRAKRLVIACGYESQKYLPKAVEELFVTYVLLSKPIAERSFWKDRALLWETDHPYLYLRSTHDNRIILGGKDDRWNGRPGFPRLPQKTAALEASLRQLMPQLAFETDYSWAGIFAGTPDGLPFIGTVPAQPHTA